MHKRTGPWVVRLGAIACGVCHAFAGAVAPGVWYEFAFDPNHSPLASGCLPAGPSGVPLCRVGVGATFLDTPPWIFMASTPVLFKITDSSLSGDFFDVRDFGSAVASTPAVALFANCGVDPNICFADPLISHTSFVLPAGAHSITIFVHPAQIEGEGFFRFDAVPEPSTVWLLGSGLMALWAIAARKAGV